MTASLADRSDHCGFSPEGGIALGIGQRDTQRGPLEAASSEWQLNRSWLTWHLTSDTQHEKKRE